MDIFSSLYLHKYRIIIQPEEVIILPPYKGSALRGLFGHSLRKIVCVQKDKDCQECLLRLKCVYSYIFETPAPENELRKYREAPHPYIITPPITKKRYFKEDEEVDFELVLIGRANDYLPYFVYAFSEMGKTGLGRERGKFRLLAVESLDAEGRQTEIYNTYDNTLRPADNRITFSTPSFSPLSCLRLNFLTPTRIKEKQDLLAKEIPFGLLIERLYERAMLLSYYHCHKDEPFTESEKFLTEAGKVRIKENRLKWYDWERHSNRKGRMKLGGLIGSITYEGDLDKFLPLLKMGQYIHVGKAVVFGLGRYEIDHE